MGEIYQVVYAGIAQVGERIFRKDEAGASIASAGSIGFYRDLTQWLV